MASLANKMFDVYFGDLLQVSNSGLGVDSTVRSVESALGTASALQLSSSIVNINGTFKIGGSTITIPNTFTISGNYTFTATLTANTSVTFPTSGTLANISGIQTIQNKTIGASTLLADSLTVTRNSNTLSWPTISAGDTIVSRDSTDTLTNKTLTSPIINAPTLTAPVLGTPASGNLSNCTAYPVASVANLGTGVATFLTIPSSANLAAAVTNETGSGSLVFATSPTLVTPVLGVASATSINFGGGALSTYVPWTTYTPTVTSATGGDTIPVYTTNSGQYTRIGDMVTINVLLSGDGGAEGSGSGALRVALPVTSSASEIGHARPCGLRLNNTTYYPLYAIPVAGQAYCILYYLDPATNTLTQMTPSLQNNTSRSMQIQFSYRV